MSGPLARALYDRLGPTGATCGAEALEPILAAALEELARTAPALTLDPTAFAEALAPRLPEDVALPAALERVRIADLGLAFACSRSDAHALSAFEPLLVSVVESAAARMGAGAAVADEAKQVVRTLLLVSPGDGPPAISTYAGRGDPRAWVRVVAVRELVRLQRNARRDVEFEDDALYEVLSPEDDPELGHLRSLLQGRFVTAFRDAVRGLPPRDRLLLRQQSIDGLSIDELGVLHGVHRATAARWVARARASLFKRTRAALMESLGIGPREADSILRLVRTRLDLSLDRMLALRVSDPPGPPGPRR